LNAKTFQEHRNNFKKNLWQSLEWSDFQIALKKHVVFFGNESSIGLGIIQNLLFGLKYLEIPRGPLGQTDKSFWDEVKKIAKENKYIFTKISPEQSLQYLPKWHFKSCDEKHPENTLILDLKLNDEELLKQMKPKGRYNIRVAQRHKIKVFESDNIEDFYSLLNETTERDNFSGHNIEYYQTMLEVLGDKAKLYLASTKNSKGKEVVISGGIFIFMDEVCTYYYGASSNEYRNTMAPYLLQWHAISEARKKGFKYYDFLGIAPENTENHSLSGVTRFKKQFGGEHISYPSAKDIVYRPFIYTLYRLYKFIRKFW